MGGIDSFMFPQGQALADFTKGPATDLAKYAVNQIESYSFDQNAIDQYRSLGGVNADKLANARRVKTDNGYAWFDQSGAQFQINNDLLFGNPDLGIDGIAGSRQKRNAYLDKITNQPGRGATILGQDVNSTSGATSVLPYSKSTAIIRPVLG